MSSNQPHTFQGRTIAQRSHLIGIEDADNLIAGDWHAIRVYLAQAVVQVARLSIHLPLGPGAAANVDHVWRHPEAPLALLAVLAVVAEVDCALAACREGCVQRRLSTDEINEALIKMDLILHRPQNAAYRCILLAALGSLLYDHAVNQAEYP